MPLAGLMSTLDDGVEVWLLFLPPQDLVTNKQYFIFKKTQKA